MASAVKGVSGRFAFSKEIRMPFANLFEAKAVGKTRNGKPPTGRPKFSMTAAIPNDHPDVKAMKQAAIAVAQAKWPGRDLKELKFPFEDGNKKIAKEAKTAEKEGRKPYDNSFFENAVALTARSGDKYPPKLAVLENGRIVDYNDDRRALAKEKIYPGAFVLLQVNFTAYEGQQDEDTGIGNPDGVNAYLDMVLKVKDGDRIGGGPSAAQVFSGYVGKMTDEDPTASSDDDLSDIGL